MTTTTKTEDPAETIKRLQMELRNAKRNAANDLTDAREHADQVLADAMEPLDRLRAGLASLHEQAHGRDPIRWCQIEPCRSLQVDYSGPAPASLLPS